MRAAIVGGIIAIMTLAAYGIVQAVWRVPAQQARVDTAAPAVAPTIPAEVPSNARVDPTNAVGAPAEIAPVAPVTAAAVTPAAPPAAVGVAPTTAPVARPAVAMAAHAAPVAAPSAHAAAPVAPAASRPIVMVQYQRATTAPTIRPAGAAPTPATAPDAATPAPAAAAAPAAAPQPALKRPDIPCNNPDALGVSRVVEIDTTGGPGFGSQHFKTLDFLREWC